MSMWGRLWLLSALLYVVYGAPTTVAPPPDQCDCNVRPNGSIAARCKSDDFLRKLQPKQATSISELDLSNANISILSKLKPLRNLEKLDLSNNAISSLSQLPYLPKLKELILSHNNMKDITAIQLPKGLEKLDISFNSFSHIPQDLISLPNLRELNIYENPVICTCDIKYVHTHHNLIAKGVVFIKPVECKSPQEFKGKPLSSLRCKHNHVESIDEMQGDDPLLSDVLDDEPKVENEDEIEKDFIPNTPEPEEYVPITVEPDEGSGSDNIPNEITLIQEDNKIVEDEDISPTDDPFAGEDYEGSGFISIESHTEDELDLSLRIHPICQFNCSTVSPITETEDPFASEAPGAVESVRILLEDVKILPTPTTTTTTEAPDPVMEEIPYRKKMPMLDTPIKSTSSVVDESQTGDETRVAADEVDRRVEETSDKANTTYVVVAALLLLVIGLVIYVMFKKRSRSNRNRREAAEKEPEKNKVEMKELLSKPTPETPQSPEKSPLINGQNGTKRDSHAQDREPEHDSIESTDSPSNTEDDSGISPTEPAIDDLEMQRKEEPENNSIAPETKRVTVQALELSGPKTPILVNRRINDDGEVITTPSAETP